MRQNQALVVLTFLALVVSVFSVVLQLYLVNQAVGSYEITANALGETRVCINHPPALNFLENCTATVDQNDTYLCFYNWTDLDFNTTPSFSRIFVDGGQVIFNISEDGIINFTPSNDHVGAYVVLFEIDDNSGCQNARKNESIDFTVLNVNDAPYLIMDIPDVRMPVNTSFQAFFLTDYFADPDGDTLSFNSTIPGGDISVSISPGGEVIFTAKTCDDDGRSMIFFAQDPYGEEAQSNIVTITVPCAAPDAGDGDGEEGTGGGSGAGATSVCKSKWICQDWFPCLPTGVQWQRCYDEHGCEPDKYFKRPCIYQGEAPACIENWLCGEWGPCFPNSTQYRSCEDLSYCGTQILLPPIEQQCVYIPTCFDGIKNGDETGIDCGGSCAACPTLEMPGPVPPPPWLTTWMLILVILSIIIMVGVARYYKAQIARGLATLGFLLKHKVYKEVLLDAEQRRSLFESVAQLEGVLNRTDEKDLDVEAIYDRMANLIRGYYMDALNLPMEMLPEEVDERLNEFGLLDETKAILKGLFDKLEILEQEELEFDPFFVRANLEELRTVVCLTSDYEQAEIVREIKEFSVTDEMSFYDEIFVRTMGVMQAVQFGQIETAKQEYLKLLEMYEPLSEAEKEEIYPELKWVFQSTRFASEMTGAKIVSKPEME